MPASLVIWGAVAIICGVFFCVYGYSLFRIVLLFVGFLVGFSLGMALTKSQPDAIRLVVSFVAGGIGGAILYFLFSLSLYIAGAILGLVIALLINSVLGVGDGALQAIIILVGGGIGAFLGKRLDELIIILATSVAGAYAIVYGLSLLFPEEFGVSADSNLVSINGLTLIMLCAIGFVGGLAQYQILKLQRRLRR